MKDFAFDCIAEKVKLYKSNYECAGHVLIQIQHVSMHV